MTFEELTKGIKNIITWYNKTNPREDKFIELLDNRDKLAGYRYLLAEFAGDVKGEYNEHYFIRRINVTKSTHAILAASKLPKNKAEIEALLEHEDLYHIEQTAEAVAYKADLLWKTVGDTLQAMQQRISFYKNENNPTVEILEKIYNSVKKHENESDN